MASAEIDWSQVRRVLVIRLRSIGDTVLITPSLIALRRFLPNAEVDVLLEDWVAPVLDRFDAVDNVLTVTELNTSRIAAARKIRKRRYDIVFNLHGGTTATFFTFASGARHRIGYKHYQYSFLHNHLIRSSSDFWKSTKLHSAEQHLALLGSVGVPVDDKPRTKLIPTQEAAVSLNEKFQASAGMTIAEIGSFALVHPAAAFETKQWPAENFAETADFLRTKGLQVIAVASSKESSVLERMRKTANAEVYTFDSLTLPEITALASKARLFVGNDSGIAHMASAVGTSSVVVFGSSNRDHWRPWTDAPNEIVFEEFPCQRCVGPDCIDSSESMCIKNVTPAAVKAAIDRVLAT